MADIEFFPQNTLYKLIGKIMGNKSIFGKKPWEMLGTWTLSLSGILLFIKRKQEYNDSTSALHYSISL